MQNTWTYLVLMLFAISAKNANAEGKEPFVWSAKCISDRETVPKLIKEDLKRHSVHALEVHVAKRANNQIPCDPGEDHVGVLAPQSEQGMLKSLGYNPIPKDPLLQTGRVH